MQFEVLLISLIILEYKQNDDREKNQRQKHRQKIRKDRKM
jgi:hypothetical protein